MTILRIKTVNDGLKLKFDMLRMRSVPVLNNQPCQILECFQQNLWPLWFNDFFLSILGKHIMQAVVLILESDNNADVKEQGKGLLKDIFF